MNPNRGGDQPAAPFEFSPPSNNEQYSGAPDKAAEQLKTPESAPSQQTAPPVSLPSAPVIPDTPAPVSGAQAGPTTTTASPPASDSNRIEKLWVDKAKSIISQTRDDPFVQKNEMSKVKAAYIEKRFNKKMRTDDALA